MLNWRSLSRRSFIRVAATGIAAFGIETFIKDVLPLIRVDIPSGASGGEIGAIKIDVHNHVFNGQDLQIGRFLKRVIALERPEYADLIRTFADVLQTLVWALAPGGSQEMHRLGELDGGSLLTFDRADVLADFERADQNLTGGLRYVLPRSEFFRLYRQELRRRLGTRGQLASLDASRLAQMDQERILSTDEVETLRNLEKKLMDIQFLDFARCFTRYRYLNVYDLAKTYSYQYGDVRSPRVRLE